MPRLPITLEVCVETIAGARAAEAGGADRIELCAALQAGGLTPSPGLMQAAARLAIPAHAMIRPRPGDFCYTAEEIDVMLADIAHARACGLGGVVLGAEDGNGGLDLAALARLKDAAWDLHCTLHRVIDCTADPALALDQAISLGFDRVLTSGGAPSAPQGLPAIASLIRRAAGRIIVMPGAGITAQNVKSVLTATSAKELHASCRAARPPAPAHLFRSTEERETDAGLVAALKTAAQRAH